MEVVSPQKALRWIAVVELFKGAVACLGGFSLAWAGPAPVKQAIAHLARAFHMDAQNGMLAQLSSRISANSIHVAVAVTLIYAAMRFIEGYGLWRTREWASWFGAISAGVYLPFEIIALLKHPHVLEASILVLNLAVVAYLIHDIRRRHPNYGKKATPL
ncbi:DUF2127 domain-containing protein [Lysobacter sp. HDW10]|uniref:DUF2127 domain-containing protein n=1 Tax=Lysobacter sp. HDW10 TaxID=2714936 RepID=UPI00140C80C7|nr:DUF2127 domain-containing protein [Lysobacter sp. HDW10]QIK81287.1 DUF2127 domain-containing protein [Lysobacter sp. HDW10]